MTKQKKHFTWVPLYQELADKLVAYRDRQPELIQLLEDIRAKDIIVTPLNDKAEPSGETFLIKEIDPFTFLGTFNRGIKTEHRLGILAEMKTFFGCEKSLPTDFDGIPVLNNQRSWFVRYQHARLDSDVPALWDVFQKALKNEPLSNQEFLEAYDAGINVNGVNVNLSMGLFWIRPNTFLNIDGTNRAYLNIDAKAHTSGEKYKQTLAKIRTDRAESFLELSLAAYLAKDDGGSVDPPEELSKTDSYWLVGASWDDVDQTSQFVDKGVWVNGYRDGRYADHVNGMQVGERIAIKAMATQKHGLPFESHGKTQSRMRIKARGTIVKNHKDGRTVEVEWEHGFEPKDWYFFTYQRAVWRLTLNDNYEYKDHAQRLIRFVFYDEPQDYQWFLDRRTEKAKPVEIEGDETADDSPSAFGIEDIIDQGVFMDETELHQILERLRDKKNLILQGAPGVGKTFVAEKLAFALMQESDRSRIKFVQFHQSYSYEDFVRGYRPLEKKAGTFGLQDGIFFDFCEQARKDERVHVLIIDEINRGNLSQIFGELLMLIEKDKRKEKYAVPLMYPRTDEPDFFVPENLYIIGMMNLADRSLALVDYALRRRFAFKTLVPKYQSEAFSNWLAGKSMPGALSDLIVNRMSELNQAIAEDESLGENYMIGHSYFCPNDPDLSSKNRDWYDGIIETEIIPLLKEYWFDDKDQQKSSRERLLAP